MVKRCNLLEHRCRRKTNNTTGASGHTNTIGPIQMGTNVRMDLLYGEWTDRRKAQVDAITVLFLITYLVFLLWGGWDSFMYSLQYGGERSPTAWRPYLWPIKGIMLTGIFLMLLQAISELFKDILRWQRIDMGPKDADETRATGEDAA